MKKQKPRNKRVHRLLYWLVILFLLSWILLWGRNSFYQVWKQKQALQELQTKSDRLRLDNDSLRGETSRLKTDPDAAEEVAREQHGMIKPDEVIYRFKPAQPDSLRKK